MHVGIVPDINDEGVAAGDGKADERWLQLRKGQIVCRNMAADMVHGNQRDSQHRGNGLGKVHPYQNRTDQPGRVGDGHRVDLLPGKSRVFQSALCQERYGFHMAAGGDFRNHAAIDRVELRLGKNLICEDLSSVGNDRDGSFITGGFKR